MFTRKKPLILLLFISLVAFALIFPLSSQAQNWWPLPPYNTLWPLWSPDLSPVDPIICMPNHLVSSLTRNTILPVQPCLALYPCQSVGSGLPWLLYNKPAALGGGSLYFYSMYGLNSYLPAYLLDPFSGAPAPMALPSNYSTLSLFLNADLVYSGNLYYSLQYSISISDLFTPEEICLTSNPIPNIIGIQGNPGHEVIPASSECCPEVYTWIEPESPDNLYFSDQTITLWYQVDCADDIWLCNDWQVDPDGDTVAWSCLPDDNPTLKSRVLDLSTLPLGEHFFWHIDAFNTLHSERCFDSQSLTFTVIERMGPPPSCGEVPCNPFWEINRIWPYPSERESPGDAINLGDIPSNKRTDWIRQRPLNPTRLDEGIQGVAHDDYHWYFIQNKRIHKWHISWADNLFGIAEYLPPSDRRITVGLPYPYKDSGYNHFCDADFVESWRSGEGALVVPIESEGHTLPPILVEYDSNLVPHSVYGLLNQSTNSAPWVSVCPFHEDLIFTSDFYSCRGPVTLNVYKRHRNSSGELVSFGYLGDFPLYTLEGESIELEKIQGGEFSPTGNLFLLAQGGVNGSGVYAFDMRSGRLFDFYYAMIEEDDNQEFEGLTIWNLDAPEFEGYRVFGQLHVILADDEALTRTDIYFKHWRVEVPTNF